MAQTKRKRRTKHRGNAAGGVEVRGRTSRPPTPEQRKAKQKEERRERTANRPPSWRRSIQTAVLAAAFVFVLLLLTNHPKKGSALVAALAITVPVAVLYIPLGYWMERFLYNRRMRQAGKAPKP